MANIYNIPGGLINDAIFGEIGGLASDATVGGIHASLHGNNILNDAVQGLMRGKLVDRFGSEYGKRLSIPEVGLGQRTIPPYLR
ncbi:TNT domain-containing protein [Arachidicoccus terrestris]|uniref:TNT domain-containing protein n=1 Tax=Arachidicoccus terrestris TaxID=2875539 RepID=UPI001CC3FED3|nr:TNT domain-containing protein [Arachidicoccus terrestris]UAY55984.1 TNT domain-containing protein [Arachidicoccus terrestris]